MREQEGIPDWALEHIRRQLRPGEEVINAVALRQGAFSGLVLLNTSRGAAVVSKPLVGEPRSALLTYPRDLVTFRCSDCSARNVVVDVTPPAEIYCTHCGGAIRLEGDVTQSQATGASETKAAPPKAKKDDKRAAATKPAKKQGSKKATKKKSAAQKTR